jgi:subtilisin family serine protease
VAAGVTDSDVARLQAAGYAIVAQRRLAVLPGITVRLRAPRRLSERSAQQQLQALIPGAILDRNHLYRANARPCRAETCFSYEGSAAFYAGVCPARGAIGMIDTRIDVTHPALAGLAIETETMHGPGYQASRSGHGTEIAILIASGAVRKTDLKILAIDTFHRSRRGDTADAYDIVAALDRLVARAVPVANLSFTGPTNALLDRAGTDATRRGMLIVAAAGNDGPSSPPRYPAAYPWAVAVTAVDRRDNVYARAVRGPHIAFAAPGVRIQLPDRAMQPGPLRSGTSYAAPLVTAALSVRRAATQASSDVVAALAAEVKDIGAPGRDPVFGWGLVDARKACPTN